MWIINTALIRPLVLALGESGEQTAPLRRAVIGGLAASTLAALTVPPITFGVSQRRTSRASASLRPKHDVSEGGRE